MTRNNEVIKEACLAISGGSHSDAKRIIETEYPFVPMTNEGRSYSEFQKTRVFLRDGFVDRYSGERMIFPPVLRLLSKLMPVEFPFHRNWKMAECHVAYWQLLPTIDHVVPVSRGGADEESNWVCTSQQRNSMKSNWLLEEIDWTLHEPGHLESWDGQLKWYMSYVRDKPGLLQDSYQNSWHRAATRAASKCGYGQIGLL